MPSVYNYLAAINRRFIYLPMNYSTMHASNEELVCCRAHAHKAAAPKKESETTYINSCYPPFKKSVKLNSTAFKLRCCRTKVKKNNKKQ